MRSYSIQMATLPVFAAAVLAVHVGAGLVASLLVFWLGGAATVFALALIPAARKPDNARTDRARADVAAPSIGFENG